MIDERFMFRGKRISLSEKAGEWIVGFYTGIDDGDCIYYIKQGDGYYSVDPETIGQCTGLRDKNGTLIWEGDIVKASQPTWGGNYEIGTVEYRTKNACFAFIHAGHKIPRIIGNYGLRDNEEYEIIGNSYDNAELLEKNIT